MPLLGRRITELGAHAFSSLYAFGRVAFLDDQADDVLCRGLEPHVDKLNTWELMSLCMDALVVGLDLAQREQPLLDGILAAALQALVRRCLTL